MLLKRKSKVNWWVEVQKVLLKLYIILNISVSTITGCISIPDFDSLFSISIGIASSAIGSKICAIAAGFKN